MYNVMAKRPVPVLLWICFTLTSVTGFMSLESLDQGQCELGKVPGTNVIPRAGFDVEHMQVLGEATALDNVEENCILKCCELGPEDCQYVWIIWSRCYAVSCTENPSDCQPMQVPHLTQFETIYFQISWSEHRPQQHSGREGVGGHRGSVDVNPSLDVLDVSEGGTSSSGPSGADSAPPVANAGPDVIITYPEETTVTLNGSLSTDDKGITSYLWQLTAEDHLDQATLINPTLPVLRVLNLTPGSYTFILTVADSLLQMSKDSVQVHVVRALSEDTTSTTTTSNTLPNSDHVTTGTGTPNSLVVVVESDSSSDATYSRKSNLIKVIIPVLISVAIILILSAVIVGMSFCLCERNRRHMKHLYRYKRLPGTIEKT